MHEKTNIVTDKSCVIDIEQLIGVTGGVLPTPASMGLAIMGAPVRALGLFAPNTVRALGAAAQARHSIYSSMMAPFGGSQAIHRNYVRAFYGPFAPR